MKHLSLVLFTVLGLWTQSIFAQNVKNSKTMEKEIKSVIETFVNAGTTQDSTKYENILHNDFRVIANRYPSADKTFIISKNDYISLISKKIIGGTPYQLKYNSIDITIHSATVQVELKSESGGQVITFLLIQNADNKWQLICNMATQTKK